MHHLPTIRQLQYLTALAEHKSFSKAAETCRVTQSTLSAGIKELETLTGQPVVDRSRRQALLTPYGRTVVHEARIILSHAAQITASARALGKPLSGPLRLGIIPTIAPYLLPAILPGLQRAYPDLELRLTEDLSDRITAQLQRGALDLILLAFPYDTQGMVQTPLFAEPFLLACPRGAWAHKRPVKMDDLAGEELLLLEEGHCLRDHALAACRYRAKAERDTFNATSLATLIQFVQHGYGMTILPEMAVKNGALPDNIEIIPFAAPAPTRQIGLAWRKGHPQEKDFELLAEAVRPIA